MDLEMENNDGGVKKPSDLSATGLSNGINRIEFSGRNEASEVSFEIWRRHGDSGDWALLDTTRDQTFEDAPVTPGQYYEYKVRAKKEDGVSELSESVVVYGEQ